LGLLKKIYQTERSDLSYILAIIQRFQVSHHHSFPRKMNSGFFFKTYASESY